MINYTMNKSNKSNDVEKKSTLAKLLATENIEVQENAVKTASFDVKDRILTIPLIHLSSTNRDKVITIWTQNTKWITK